jgi:Concanavalin A-like lectin/glucanases superfamily
VLSGTAILAISVLVPTLAVGQDPSQGEGTASDTDRSSALPPGPLAPPDPSGLPHETSQSKAEEPATEAEQHSSETAYADESTAESRQLLKQAFSDELANLDQEPGRALEPSDYEKFFSDTVARIKLPGEEGTQLLVSSSSLRDENEEGAQRPIDLGIEREAGHFEAENPLVNVSMPGDAGGQLSLQGARVGIRLESSGATAAPGGALEGDKVFYHEAAPDTDLMFAPKTQGAEILAQLRSIDSPERLSFHVELPHGAGLRKTGEQDLEIARAGERLALISNPSAVDADGEDVPTYLEQTGPTSFDLVTRHSSGDSLYPILVDPLVEDWYNNSWAWGDNRNFNGWTDQSQTNTRIAAQKWCIFTQCWGRAGVYGYWGLYLAAGNGWQVAANDFRQWVYTVPEPDAGTGLAPSAYITRGYFGPMYFARGGENNWVTPYAFWGLYSRDAGRFGPGNSYYNATGIGMTGGAQDWYPTPPASGGDRINHAVFGMGNNYDRWTSNKLTADRTAALGGMYITIDDPESPSISAPAAAAGAPSLSSWLPEGHDVTGPNSYKAKVQGDNPSLYWRLGETSGATASDTSGHGNVGTYANGPGLGIPGAVAEGDNKGGAVDVNGSNQFMSSTYATRRNLITNPSIETNTSGFGNWGTVSSVTRDATQGQTGAASLKVTGAASGSGVWAGNPAGVNGGWIPVTPGQYYSAAVQLRGGDSQGIRLQLGYIDAARTTWKRIDETNVSASSGWTRGVINGSTFGPAPAGAAYMMVLAMNHNSNKAQSYSVDAVQLEPGATIGPYFDGSSPDASWEGTPNNSASKRLGPFVNGGTRTFEGWALRDTDTTVDTLFGGSAPSNAPRLRLEAGSKDVSWRADAGTGTAKTWTAAWPGSGQWVHWALVFDEAANAVALYINGSLVSSKLDNDQFNASAGSFMAGARGATSDYFDGKLDEVAAYDHALSPDRIQAHHAAGPSGLGWVTATATDPGLGLQSMSSAPGSGFKLTYAREDGSQAVLYDRDLPACNGTRMFGTNCGSKHAANFPFNSYNVTDGGGPLPQGISTLTLTATDALGKTTSRNFDARVDRKHPDIRTTGGLRSHSVPGYDLHVEAADWLDPTIQRTNTAADRPYAQSGVKRIDLFMDAGTEPIASTGDRPCTATYASCPLALDDTLNPAEYPRGVHRFKAVAIDQLGHPTVEEWDQVVNAEAPTIDSVSGEALEGWHHNDSPSLSVTAHDDDVGISRVTVDVPGLAPYVKDYQCDLDCPTSVSRTLEIPASAVPEGVQTVTVRAYGPNSDQAAVQTAQMRVNHATPMVTDVTGPTGWLRDGTAEVTVTAHADGAGVERTALDFPGGPSVSHSFNCSDSGCDHDVSHEFEVAVVSLQQGHNQGNLKLFGPGGTATAATFTLDVDRTAPGLTATGRLLDAPSVLVSADERLELDIQDQGSGVGTVSVAVDGSEVQSKELSDFPDDAQICQGTDCSFHADDSVDLSGVSPGQHTVTMSVTDLAGNSTSRSNAVVVDPTPPILEVSGDLAGESGLPLPRESASASIASSDSAAGDSGIKKLTVEVDGTQVADRSPDCSAGCPATAEAMYEYVKAIWPPGPHQVTFKASDVADNQATETITADAPPPSPKHPSCPTEEPDMQAPLDPLTASEAATDLDQHPNSPLAPTVPTTDPETGAELDPVLITPDPDTSPEPNIDVSGTAISGATSSEPAGGFILGDVACLRPQATTSAETDALLIGGDQPWAALYANSAPQTDTLYRPMPDGAAIVLNLRGPIAPDHFKWEVTLDPGETIVELSSGGLAIVDTTVDDPPPCDDVDPSTPGTFTELGDAAAQHARSVNELCIANNEVSDGWVRGIIEPPIAEDQAGHPVPVTLEWHQIPDVPEAIVVDLGLPSPPSGGVVGVTYAASGDYERNDVYGTPVETDSFPHTHCLRGTAWVGTGRFPPPDGRGPFPHGFGYARATSTTIGFDPGPSGGGASCHFPEEVPAKSLAVNLGMYRRPNRQSGFSWCTGVPTYKNSGREWQLDAAMAFGSRPLCGAGEYKSRTGVDRKVDSRWVGKISVNTRPLGLR